MNIKKKMMQGTIVLVLLSISSKYLAQYIFGFEKLHSLVVQGVLFGVAAGWFLASKILSKHIKG